MNGLAQEQTRPKIKTDSTKIFSFDENTGEVQGCNLLKLQNEKDRKDLHEIEESEADSLLKKISKKYKLRGEYKRLYFSSNRKYFTCVTWVHGGYNTGIYFFDKNSKLLNTYNLKKSSSTSILPSFNTEGTFFKFSLDNGDFFFFKPNGVLFYSGNVHSFNGSKDLGMGSSCIDISEDGKDILISHIKTFIVGKDSKIRQSFDFECSSSQFNRNRNQLFVASSSSIKFINLLNGEIIYESKGNFNVTSIKDNKIIIQSMKDHRRIRQYKLVI
ncbi:MAG: hypothetical protein ACOYOA_05500 [Saprospiraceae bacterium]